MKRFILCVWLQASVLLSCASSEDILDQFLNELKSKQVQTGDLVFWALNKMDSVLIQKFTEGPFSHAGVLEVDPDGKLWIYDVYPGMGLRKSVLENQFGAERANLVALALVRYKGNLDRSEIKKRLDGFWARRAQIQFDQSMALEEGGDYGALLKGDNLSLYCTEFVYRVFEGAAMGIPLYENDYPRVYKQKDLFSTVPADAEIIYEFQRGLGVHSVEQFQKWLTSHKSRILISANGMIRGSGFEIIFQVRDTQRLKSWSRRLLDSSQSDSPVSEMTTTEKN